METDELTGRVTLGESVAEGLKRATAKFGAALDAFHAIPAAEDSERARFDLVLAGCQLYGYLLGVGF